MESCALLITAGCIDYITQGRYDYSKDQINSTRNAFAQQRTAGVLNVFNGIRRRPRAKPASRGADVSEWSCCAAIAGIPSRS